MSDKRLEVNKAVHESMNIKNLANVIIVIFTVISPLKVMVKRKTYVFQILQAKKEESEGECQPRTRWRWQRLGRWRRRGE